MTARSQSMPVKAVTCRRAAHRVPRTLEKRVRSWVRFQFTEAFEEGKVSRPLGIWLWYLSTV